MMVLEISSTLAPMRNRTYALTLALLALAMSGCNVGVAEGGAHPANEQFGPDHRPPRPAGGAPSQAPQAPGSQGVQ